MKKQMWSAAPLIAVAMMTVATMAPAQSSVLKNTTQYDLKRDKPYQDGLLAAKLDRAARRPIDAMQSYLFVHPPVKDEAREAYRTAFTIGYKTEVALQAPSVAGQ